MCLARGKAMSAKGRAKTAQLKPRELWRLCEEAFERSGLPLATFEVSATLSVAQIYSKRHSVGGSDPCALYDELIGLHPVLKEVDVDSDWFVEVFEEEEVDFLRSHLLGPADLSIFLGLLHQWCLAVEEQPTATTPRKKKGAYYTPKRIVSAMLDSVWPEIIDTDSTPQHGHLTLCDPACGSGQFLVMFLEEYSKKSGTHPALIAGNLYGVDLDAVAVWLCRISLYLSVKTSGEEISSEDLENQIRVGNSLLGAVWEAPSKQFSSRLIKELGCTVKRPGRLELGGGYAGESRVPQELQADGWFATCLMLADADEQKHWVTAAKLEAWGKEGVPDETRERWTSVAKRHNVFHWMTSFPEIAARGGFDLIIGNPPYVNSIELEMKTGRLDAIYQDEDRSLRGSADLAYQFLRRGLSLVREGGGVYFLLPRPVYAALSLREFWQTSRPEVWLKRAILFDNHRIFEGASIFVSAAYWKRYVGSQGGVLSVTRYDKNDGLLWHRTINNTCRDWWRAISGCIDGGIFWVESDCPRIEEQFEVAASMTTGEFYDCRAYLHDSSESSNGIPMITSGAIDPGDLKWGRLKSRILGEDYLTPRLRRAAFDENSPLRRRRERAKRPKILVAGLAARIEAVLIKEPAQGAVSTFTITHPSDDVVELEKLSELLNSHWVSSLLHQTLGANALGGGNITVSKEFIMNLPLKAPLWSDLSAS